RGVFGRTDTMVKVKGVKLYPTELAPILAGFGLDPRGFQVLVSQLFFALSHLPHYSLPFPVPVGLAVLWFTGVLLALMWLRTGNLLMAVGWHGLMDLPYHLTAAPAGWPAGVTYLVGLLLLAVWPRAAAWRAR
uniref:CPBP family intramembrane glutamic endopeptidase n=1 Tax=Oceanithermus sp. TaxID=2268145 RepID=UPI00257AA639